MNNNNRRNNNKRTNNKRNNNRRTEYHSYSKGGFGMTEIFIIIIVIFGIGAIYYYMQQNNPYAVSEPFTTTKLTPANANEMNMCLFYTEWCGHCQNFKPEWEKAKKQLDGKKINGVKVNFHEIDCDKEEDLAKEYNVSGYPTVKCIKKDEVKDYDGERSEDAVVEFCRAECS